MGVPYIARTTMKVVELVSSHLAYGGVRKSFSVSWPDYSVIWLSYYWDHKAEIDADMLGRERYVEELRREAGPSELAARLRAKGYLV